MQYVCDSCSFIDRLSPSQLIRFSPKQNNAEINCGRIASTERGRSLFFSGPTDDASAKDETRSCGDRNCRHDGRPLTRRLLESSRDVTRQFSLAGVAAVRTLASAIIIFASVCIRLRCSVHCCRIIWTTDAARSIH